MVYRIAGGLGLALLGLGALGIAHISNELTGVFLLVGGIALLAGF